MTPFFSRPQFGRVSSALLTPIFFIGEFVKSTLEHLRSRRIPFHDREIAVPSLVVIVDIVILLNCRVAGC